MQRYGSTLKKSHELPSFVVELENNNGYQKYVNEQGKPHQLEGDIDALKYVDLDQEGLTMYRPYLTGSYTSLSTPTFTAPQHQSQYSLRY